MGPSIPHSGRGIGGAAFALFLASSGLLGQRAPPALISPSPDDQYVPGPDSQPQAGVPTGKTFDFAFDTSNVFRGTKRKVTVYIPAEYMADKPACLYVGLDSLSFSVPVVFDNLIYKKEMPVTIALGVPSGEVKSAEATQNPRFNRSLEFDGMNGDLARFLIEEIIPEVERHTTPDGQRILISQDPNDRAIGGASTGAIGSFTVAWERPDSFRRVFTAIGTFVGMRGGDHYPVLIRKTEPKPIRIFMQDGSHDGLDGALGEVGDWWMSNQTMLRALQFSGYEVGHTWGEGTHNMRHPTAVIPDAMRWLWKDWPRPVRRGETENTFLGGVRPPGRARIPNGILLPDEDWQQVPGAYRSSGVVVADPQGNVLFQDREAGKTWAICCGGQPEETTRVGGSYEGIAFGANGCAYIADPFHASIVACATDGSRATVAKGVHGLDLVVDHSGTIFLTEPGSGDIPSGRVWRISSNGEKVLLDSGLDHPTGIALSPDGLWLAVAENRTHWGYSYRVTSNGNLQAKQRFYWFHVPDNADDSGAGAWVMDQDGRLYAASRMGIQVFDRNGRSRAILPVPGVAVTGVSFGGAGFDILYVACADQRLYRRKLNVSGAPAWAKPIVLPKWSAG